MTAKGHFQAANKETRLLEPQPGQRNLDIATGSGLTTWRLAMPGAEAVTFDFSIT